MKLAATRVKALRDPGRYSDGDGLHLFISKTGGKSWVLRTTVDGRRRDIGLGGYPAVSLAQARKRAADNREAIGDGKDPTADKRRPATPTFSEAAHAVHEVDKPSWRNERHTLAWIQTLERHVFPRSAPSHRHDRPRRRVDSPHAHMVNTARDRPARTAKDARDIRVGHGE